MNFDQAIAAHSEWKRKLSPYANNPDGSLKPVEVAFDNKCDLGKWIVGEGAKFSKLPEHATLKSEHTHFHKAAADIVRRADAGESVSEELVVDAKGEFITASRSVVQAIVAMRAKT